MSFSTLDKCYKCKIQFNPWNAPPHFTRFLKIDDIILVIYPLCDECWKSSDPKQIIDFYFQMYMDWSDEGYLCQYRTQNNQGALLTVWALIVAALNRELNIMMNGEGDKMNEANQE